MELDGFTDERKNFLSSFPGSDTTRKIRHVSTVGGRASLNNYEVCIGIHSCFFRPACFRALFSVPGGISTLGFPETVTVPFFVGW